MTRRRVAVTGLGVVATCGIGNDAFWDGLCGPAPVGDRVVLNFDPTPHFGNPKEVRRSDRCTQFAIAAADMALEQAGSLTADPTRRGVFIGTGIGGIQTLEDQILVMHEKGARGVSPFLVPMMMPNAAPAAVSMKHGFQGPAENTCTACAAGTHAIANAARLIAHGRCDVVLAGGSEAPFVDAAIAGFTNMTAFSSAGISRPFDAERDGFVMGEGGAVLVLESLEHAEQRGADIVGEIAGFGFTADAHHITQPSEGGEGGVRSMRLAMENANLRPDEIDYINAHGTSTPYNDRSETQAIKTAFGEASDRVVVSSSKSMTGHLLGAGGAMEAAFCILAIRDGIVPPTINLENPDPDCDLDYVPHVAREMRVRTALSNSFGFGGHNTALIFKEFS